MQKPGRLDFTPEQIEGLLDRIDQQWLEKSDYPILSDLIKAIVWMNLSLQEKELTIRRLRSVFGIKTETAKKLLNVAQGTKAKSKAGKNKDPKKGQHGHKPASAFTDAKTIDVAHQT